MAEVYPIFNPDDWPNTDDPGFGHNALIEILEAGSDELPLEISLEE